MTLKALREAAHLTQREVAEKLGITLSAVCHYEQGIRSINLEQILLLAELYEAAAEDVIRAQLESIIVR